MFTEQEKQIITWGKANGKTQQEVEQALVRLRTGSPVQKAPEVKKEPGYLERVGQQYFKAGEAVALRYATPQKENFPGEKILRTAGDIAGAALAPVAEAISPVIKPVVEKLLSVPEFKNSSQGIISWAEAHPDAAKNLESIFNVSTLGLGGVSEKVIKQGIDTTINTAKTITKDVVDATGKVIKGAKEVVESSEIGRIPTRIATNVAEKQAVEATIKELPTKIAQTAARDGVDVADIKYLYNLPKEQKAQLKELAETTKQFAKDQTKTNPIEVVGKPIVGRIKQLNSEKGRIGKELGEASKALGVVTKEEVEKPVFDALVKVIDGLTVKNGVLNFKNTVLTTAETLADRKAIQSIFTQATKWGSGEAKHKLRQELFEILGGKKKSLQNITGTQEKAFQAIRKGLADVLDAKNSTYKALNMEFAKVAQPLQDIQRFMKNVAGADEDILDMSAGLLARRLTSNAASNPQLRSILRALDEATAKAGKTELSVETLQDFYNILDKYYDIAAKTGFKGQIKSAVEGSGGIVNRVIQKIQGLAGETPAVRQKALEDLLNEILE